MSENTMSYTSMSLEIIPGYLPFIADVDIESFAEPFPIIKKDRRSHLEINEIKHQLRDVMYNKRFPSPVKLSDFCLIAKEKWDSEDSGYSYSEYSQEDYCCEVA